MNNYHNVHNNGRHDVQGGLSLPADWTALFPVKLLQEVNTTTSTTSTTCT